jgi:hypothetical protein
MTSRATAGGKFRIKEVVKSKGLEELDWLEETEEEAREYDQRIKDEIRWKLEPIKPRDERPVPATSSPEPEGGGLISDPMAGPSSEPTLQNSSEPLGDIDRDGGGIELEDQGEGLRAGHVNQTMMDFSMPSFRPSHIAHSTPKPISTSTSLRIPTPDPYLPPPHKVVAGPSKTPRHPTSTLVDETPAHIGLQAGQADQTRTEFSMPSFRPSNIAHSTPKPISTSTFPHIPTPTFTSTPNLHSPAKATPGPSKTPRHHPTTLVNETPMHVDSPMDTPTGEGRGRRDDPATPVPLGVEKFNLLKGKKDFQTLTKHFEMFTKQSERQKKLAAEPITRKGKMAVQAKGSEVLGGKVFEGLRICFPPELGNTSKQKTHWDIVSALYDCHYTKLSLDIQKGWPGHFTTRYSGHTRDIRFRPFSPNPSSATWSPISIRTTSRNSLRTIRLGSPLLTSCTSSHTDIADVKGKLVDTGPYLSFPKNVFTRGGTSTLPGRGNSRMTDITDILRGKSSISR